MSRLWLHVTRVSVTRHVPDRCQTVDDLDQAACDLLEPFVDLVILVVDPKNLRNCLVLSLEVTGVVSALAC